jgi:hypothetical protein
MTFFKNTTAVRAPVADTSDETIERPSFEDVAPQEYKDRFPVETAGLTLDEIYEAVAETEDDMNDPQWKMFFLKIKRSSSPNVPNIDGDALAANAIKMAASVGPESNAVIQQMADAKEVLDLGRFRLLFALQSDFDQEMLDGFPVPDSEEGNNPDHFKVDKIGADGKTSKAWTTFYTVLADNTVMGTDILSNIEMLQRLSNPQALKDDISDELKALDPHARENKLNYWIGRRGTLRKAYKEAMRLYFQFAAVNNFPGIKAEPMWMDGRSPDDEHADGLEIENTTKPIQVWLVPEEGKPIKKWEALSVSAFMKLNVKKAIEKGATFTSLMESGIVPKAKPGTGATAAAGQNEKKLRIETLPTMRDVVAEFHRFVDTITRDKTQAEYGKLLKMVNEKDNDEEVTALVELSDFLNMLRKDAGLDKRYVKIQSATPELAKAS